LLFFEPVSFAAQLINLVEHSFQERFCRCSGNPSPLKLADFAALTLNLGAHSLDFVPDSLKLHRVLARPKPVRSAGGPLLLGGPPAQVGVGGSKDG
jgi:hypothetical protein